jgi:lysine-N-methylase
MPDDRTLRYMDRFACIGPECEDNCCYGWRVEVDRRTREKLAAASALTSREERQRVKAAIQPIKQPGRREPLYFIRMRPDENCPMLEGDGLCHIQARFGEKLLPDVCATYPRRIQTIGDAVELSGMMSCPEISRQVLLHEDSMDLLPLDRDRLPRVVVADGMDPRDLRPYFRLMMEVRAFMLRVLRDKRWSLEQRLFFMTWFAKRSAEVLNKKVMRGDLEPVRRELGLLTDDSALDEIARRFDAVECPSALVLLLARELVVRAPSSRSGQKFRELVESVFESYVDLRGLVGDAAPVRSGSTTPDELWAEYRRRKAAVLERARPRVEQFLVNAAANFWVHRLPSEAPDLMVAMLRMLAQMAVQKFLLFSHPALQGTWDDGVLDRVAVEIFYRVARYIEHSPLSRQLEEALDKKQLKSFGGAVYLVRF